ncbi:MAG TPA: hypothetical protein VJ966_14525 [Actinomycetes bacterium]|nr:hypothetical protein [Actinomycetes bacterium]
MTLRLAEAVHDADRPAGADLDGSPVQASGDPELLAHWLEHSRLEPA